MADISGIFNSKYTGEKIEEILDKANKAKIPTLASELTNDMDYVSDENYVHTDENFTAEDKSKIHEHENKNVLDNFFSTIDNKLMYNDSEVVLDGYLDNYYTKKEIDDKLSEQNQSDKSMIVLLTKEAYQQLIDNNEINDDVYYAVVDDEEE